MKLTVGKVFLKIAEFLLIVDNLQVVDRFFVLDLDFVHKKESGFWSTIRAKYGLQSVSTKTTYHTCTDVHLYWYIQTTHQTKLKDELMWIRKDWCRAEFFRKAGTDVWRLPSWFMKLQMRTHGKQHSDV